MKTVIETPAIFLYSASDRFNYGDLMYQIILKKILNEILGQGNYLFFNFALTKSKQTHLGADDTIDVTELWHEKYRIYQNKYLFIGGGDMIPIDFESMISHYDDKVDLSCLMKKIEYPFVIDDDYILSNYKVIYQSIGGSTLKGDNQGFITESIEKAHYIFTRDLHTKERLGIKKIKQYPDLVSLMPKFFSKDELNNYVSEDFINWKKIYDIEDYIVFQCSLAALEDNEEVNKQLQRISDKTHLPIVLLSIGNCNSHDDFEALEKLLSMSSYKCILIKPKTVLEIASIISNSSLFIGSSLHGCITAQSYNVPIVALCKTIPKLHQYLQTNSSNRQDHKLISINNFKHYALKNIKHKVYNYETLNKKSDYISDLYTIFGKDNFNGLENNIEKTTEKTRTKSFLKNQVLTSIFNLFIM